MKTAKNTTCAIALAIAATLAACSAEGEPMGEQPIDPTTSVPLKVTAALQSSVTASATRATPTAVPLKAGSIGIFLRDGSANQLKHNIKYTATDGVWNAVAPSEPIYLTGYSRYVAAYYPYSGDITIDPNAYSDTTVNGMATQDYDETKLLYGAEEVQMDALTNNGAVCFTLKHIYTRVRLHITYTGKSSDWRITELGLYNQYLHLEANYRVYNGSWKYGKTGNYIIKNLPATPLTVDTYTRDLLLITPSLRNTPLVVKMTINGQKLKAVIPAHWNPRRGELYDINITVRGTEVLPVTVTTTDWEVVTVPGGSYLPIP